MGNTIRQALFSHEGAEAHDSCVHIFPGDTHAFGPHVHADEFDRVTHFFNTTIVHHGTNKNAEAHGLAMQKLLPGPRFKRIEEEVLHAFNVTLAPASAME